MSRKVCRLCLSYPVVCFSLLDKEVSEMIESLTSLRISSDDDAPTVACARCLLNVRLAFSIQQNILRANEKLKEDLWMSVEEIKVETVEQKSGEKQVVPSSEPGLSEGSLNTTNCIFCAKDISEDLMIKHVKDHFNEKQFCDLCGIYCNNVDEFREHNTDKHAPENNVCLECGLNFRYKSLYNIHLKEAHPNDDELSLLKYGIRSKQVVKFFLEEKAKQAKMGPFKCDVCLKSYPTKRQLAAHCHDKGICPICNAEITKSNLRKHISNHSSGPQICELCGSTLSSLESLRGHMSHAHSNRSFNCDECGKVFRKRYTFLLHQKKHSGQKNHVCETCGKSFYTLYYLNKHIRMAHLKLRPHICEYCKKAFSSRFALKTHIRQHTNETPYKCEICGEGFRQNVSLKAHRKSKHNIIEETNCECNVCGKMFTCEQAVVSHMRLH